MGLLSRNGLSGFGAAIRGGRIKILVPLLLLALLAFWWAAGAVSQEGEVVWAEALNGHQCALLVLDENVCGVLS